MRRMMLMGKVHRATVTDANLNYEGSLTLDPDLMEAAGMLPYEQVQVLDVDNGARLTTYLIEGERSTGQVCINGAAARLVGVSLESSVVWPWSRAFERFGRPRSRRRDGPGRHRQSIWKPLTRHY